MHYRRFTMQLDDESIARLNALAAQHQVSASAIARSAVRKALADPASVVPDVLTQSTHNGDTQESPIPA